MELKILYEDEDILVLDKPTDTPIHPSMGNYENTLANGVAHYYQTREQPLSTAVSTVWTVIPLAP